MCSLSKAGGDLDPESLRVAVWADPAATAPGGLQTGPALSKPPATALASRSLAAWVKNCPY
jgi:hypothetical protein